MSNLLELTDYHVKSKSFEKKSGKNPNKLKFTAATILSLQKNIDYEFLDKAINKLNTIYSEMISAVEIAEKVKAEEEARSKISGNKELESRIEEDEKISKMTDAAIVNKRMKKVTIELLKLAGRIGTYKDNYGINVKKGFTPKSPRAISVQQLYANVYKSIMNKIDLYKMAEKKGLEVSENGAVVTSEEDVPSWRKLFDNMQKIPSDVTVAMNKSKDDEEEVEMVQPSSNIITEEDKSYRKMLAQLGDEFALIDNYKKSTNGVPSQFKEGFELREQNLSKIFYDLTGIEIKKKNSDEYEIKDNTEFQNLIDQVNGYKEPLSEKEHKEMEESLNDYYSRDEVASKISELNEKDVLYTFNQHMDDVIKAEIKENNKDAVDVVQVSNEETMANAKELANEKELAELKVGAEEQARMLKTLYDYMDMRDRFEEEKAERERQEKQELLDGALEQAKMLNETNLVIDAAHEVAQNIVNKQLEEIENQKTKDMIITSAEDEAQRIVNEQIKEQEQDELNNMIIASAKEEAKRIQERNEIIDSAHEEAQKIYNQNMILDSAEVEAQRLNDLNMLASGAEEQAIMIINEQAKENEQQKTKDMIITSAEVEAQRLNNLNMIVDGAEEQAKMIINKERETERNEILESAKVEAQRINDLNMIADGAKEQARLLQNNNEYLDILESADVQARIIINKSKKESLLEEAKALSERLKNINEETNKIDLSIAKSIEEDVLDNTYNLEEVAKKANARKKEDEEILASAKEEAKRIQERNEIIDSAHEEAQKIYNQNMILDSAEVEAKRLQERNELIDSAEVEARRLQENNEMLESAEVEAKRIQEKNMILESAEEEARKLVVNEPTVENLQTPVINQVAPQETETKTAPIVSQVTPVVEQTTTEETPVVAQVTSPSPVVKQTVSYSNNLQLLDNDDRYGELTKKSNALLVKKTRIDNITNRINSSLGSPISKKKEILNSLKEELETGNYSFLQRSENIDEMIPSAKVA